jgi:hypothetical protein
MKRRFWRIFRLLVLLAAVIAAVAVILVNQGDPTLHVNMLVATALGVFCTALLGTALMTLVFLSSDSGHDDAAASTNYKEKE